MNKEAQQALESLVGRRLFWEIDENQVLLLELLNIICLIPGINYSVLNIRSLPVMQSGSY